MENEKNQGKDKEAMSTGVEGATSDEQEDQPCDIWEAKVSRSHRVVLEARLASISISGRW